MVKRLTPHLNNNCKKFKEIQNTNNITNNILFFVNSPKNILNKNTNTEINNSNSHISSVFLLTKNEEKDNISLNNNNILSIFK